ncbi:MAG: YihA family ribosome biogenesis GTP-binding protein [Saprospiraceae bacterium]|jgi:GTP-binding protein|nr:YihA family ribosome biogenesis GTP-binding protein [Saprospiraceae bacterium]MBL0025681.1 YihA family ribosome biogenesis GTP-binding protein [Saprospiraceae bacterium]
MKIKDVTFIASYPKASECPEGVKPEFAFIGRSNVGKSSLINMLTNKKGIAKVSVTPGKTQLINFFEINESWYLVDLPGYGYARASKTKKESFSKIIRSYLTQRSTLYLAFILIDIRHPLQAIDREFIDWCGANSVPFSIVFTKSDKIGRSQVSPNVQTIIKELLKSWNELPPHFVSSAETKEGQKDILDYISSVIDASSIEVNQEVINE